jgi:hypothetical protein
MWNEFRLDGGERSALTLEAIPDECVLVVVAHFVPPNVATSYGEEYKVSGDFDTSGCLRSFGSFEDAFSVDRW